MPFWYQLLLLLPCLLCWATGNTPYQGTYFNKQQQRQQQSTYAAAAAPTPPAATAGVQQLPFLPEAASSQQEQNWMEIFTSYNSWWDNRANVSSAGCGLIACRLSVVFVGSLFMACTSMCG